jgi:RNA polymerase sigma-70 factor (ECF subfamily)
MASTPSDKALLAAFIQGENAMFGELVRRYEGPLHAFLCRLTGEPGEVPELFQETFVRAFRHAASFRGDSSFRTWLYAIAVNVCRSRLREARAARPSPLGRGEGEGAERERGEARDPSPGPNGDAESHELGQRIAQAVGALPGGQREVFILKAYDGLSYPEIAEALGRPLGTVKSQMRLALGKLRVALHQIAQAYGLA